jgi:GMP synthase-like glutamine amidotransferase
MLLRVDIVADADDMDPGFIGERLVDHFAADLQFRDRDNIRRADSTTADLVLLLGSARSAHAAEQSTVVEAESHFVRSALDSMVPVIGICYGAQLLAHALGGTVGPSPYPEIGWYGLTSYDGGLCPAGPWTQFHSDAFMPPPHARVLGTSRAGCQGFADSTRAGRALGWQFHPEVTPTRFITWVERLRAYCTLHGVDPNSLVAAAPEREATLRQAAYDLTDAAMAWLLGPEATVDHRKHPTATATSNMEPLDGQSQ